MNDPHVVALHYTVEHASWIDYSRAEPLVVHYDPFDVRVEDGHVSFSMKHHFATERDARDAVDEYIRAWELEAALARQPDTFKLRFDRSDIEDRDPKPGVKYVRGSPVRFAFAVGEAQCTVSPATYPKPPSERLEISPDVERMYNRYVGYRENREPLTTVAYFCLTVLQASTGESRDQRLAAANKYCISKPVLDQVGNLSSTRGGAGARKGEGVHRDLTPQERQFLEEAVKTIIRRAAEVASDSDARLAQITVGDLPQI